MEGRATLREAKEIFGDYYIGKEELLSCVPFIAPNDLEKVPELPYSKELLAACADKYVLVLGISTMLGGKALSLINLREYFGVSPEHSEPCFYNQDWYLQESFVLQKLEYGWFLIRRKVYEESRAVLPTELEDKFVFPSAIQCAYAFFVCWYCCEVRLWEYDFVWCRDKDHNGDRIYVGKYKDLDGVNKNGFSIHRHLALRNCYGGIDWIVK